MTSDLNETGVASRRFLIALDSAATIIPLATGVATAAGQSQSSTQAKACKTTYSKIARDIRLENKFPPLTKGTRARDVTACRGRWAVITRPGQGDTSFNARYRAGSWHHYYGYPMPNCAGVPSWLCPQHP